MRRLPLRSAGIIGVVSALVYLGGVLGLGDTEFLPQAVFWFVVMLAAGLLAWFAGKFRSRGRAAAMTAAILFFVVALFSGASVFVVAFLVAALLSVAGFAGVATPEEETSIEG